MASAQSAAAQEELEAHLHAYQQIFRAVIRKRNLPPETGAAMLGKLKPLQQAITHPDEYLDRIGDFAQALGVKPEALASFIGANLLPALEGVRRELKKRKADAAAAASAAPTPAVRAAEGAAQSAPGPASSTVRAGDSFLAELLRSVGGATAPGDRFVEEDYGILKLIGAGGERLGRSASALPPGAISGVAAEAAVPVADAAPSPGVAHDLESVVSPAAAPGRGDPGPAGRPASAGASRAAAPAAVSGGPERSILAELLEKCGAYLNVTERLEPRDYAEETIPVDEAPPAHAVDPTAGQSDANSGPVAPRAPPVRPQRETQSEGSILAEILSRFGNALNVTGPLEPSSGLPDEAPSGAPLSPAGAIDLLGASAEAAGENDFDYLPLTFQDYLNHVKSVQDFQASGDQAAYRTWLGQGSDATRAVVGLRNLEVRSRGEAGAFDWDQEYEKLAAYMQLDTEQIAELHRRIRCFEQMHRKLNEFIAAVKSNPPPVVDAMKRIWPQVRLLFNEETWQADRMMTRLKIPLLQIPDPALKERVSVMMRPLFEQAESLASAAAGSFK